MNRRAWDSFSARVDNSVAPWARSSIARSCSAAAAATASASWLEVWAAVRAWPSVWVMRAASSALWRPTSATRLPARAASAAVARHATALLGQLVDLVRDDGEAAAVHAGPRRLDRSVERQQVRLVRDEA